jgi:hypothetical protein
VRQFDGEVWWNWFGPVQGDAAGANAAANGASWTAMRATLAALRFNSHGSTVSGGIYGIAIDAGEWETNVALDVADGAVRIRGMGVGGSNSGTQGAGTTVIKCYDCSGIRLQGSNTSGGSTIDGTNHQSAFKSSVTDLQIEGNFSGVEAEYHGVHAKAPVHLTRIHCFNFAGEGFHLSGDDTVGGEGGAINASRLDGCEAYGCRDGLKLVGQDANVIPVIGGVFGSNRRWGVNDESGLGNFFAGIETHQNGIVAANDGVAIPATQVSYGGNRYFVLDGQETAASTNAPSGTTADNAYWAYIAAGGATPGVPAWFSGISLRAGGCYRVKGQVAASVFSGCYSEFGQGYAQLKPACIVVGGILAGQVYMNDARTNYAPGRLAVTSGGLPTIGNGLQIFNPLKMKVNFLTSTNHLWDLFHPTFTDATFGLNLMFANSGDLILTSKFNQSVGIAWRYTGDFSTTTFADGLVHPNVLFVSSLYLPSASGGAPATGKPVFRAATSSNTYNVATYTAPSGGTTVDTQGRASLALLAADNARLAADLADMKAKFQAAGLMS